MHRFLLLSFYYPPDLSAGSFRAFAFVEALQAETSNTISVDIIAASPNRYHTFSAVGSPGEEQNGSVRIRRISIPGHKGGFLDQALAFSHYAAGVWRLTRREKYDIVIATSSRLLTATLGAAVAKRSRARLYLDLRDIFAETLPDILPAYLDYALRPTISYCEKWTLRRADKVNLVSPAFRSWFETRYPEREFTCFTNGIDRLFADLSESERTVRDGPLTVLYAGNVGDGQGLHSIVPELARRLRGRVRFRVIGGGGRMEVLRKAVAGLDNVELLPPVSREALRDAYREADILFVHLNSHKPFLRVLPSKLFEYGATGKPIWAGVAGYSAEFIEREVANAVVFDPCDADAAMAAFEKLDLEARPRHDFISKYSRERIMRGMARDVLTLTAS